MPSRPMLAQLVSRVSHGHFEHHNPDGTIKATVPIQWPLWGTPKIDGRRCVKINNSAMTRSWKYQENEWVQEQVSALHIDGLDGELIVPDMEFNDCESCFKTHGWVGDFRYLIFDYCANGWEHMTHSERFAELTTLNFERRLPDWCTLLHPTILTNETELANFEERCLEGGFEGVCLRAPWGLYKSGRSTLSQQWLLKRKPFVDAEAEVIGFTALQRNTNPPEINELGLLKRSKRIAGMVADNLLGTISCRDLRTGAVFEIGTGFDSNQRVEIWANQSQYLGQLVNYKYQAHGMKDKPRCPVFRGFRYDLPI